MSNRLTNDLISFIRSYEICSFFTFSRLELEPNLCPKEIYDELLMPCWHQDAHLRPDFSHILRTIDKFLNECGEDV